MAGVQKRSVKANILSGESDIAVYDHTQKMGKEREP